MTRHDAFEVRHVEGKDDSPGLKNDRLSGHWCRPQGLQITIESCLIQKQ